MNWPSTKLDIFFAKDGNRLELLEVVVVGITVAMALYRNKLFMLNVMFQRNAMYKN